MFSMVGASLKHGEDAPDLGLSLSVSVGGCSWLCLSPCHKSQALCLSLSQELVFLLPVGDTLRAEVRAEEAGKVDEDRSTLLAKCLSLHLVLGVD